MVRRKITTRTTAVIVVTCVAFLFGIAALASVHRRPRETFVEDEDTSMSEMSTLATAAFAGLNGFGSGDGNYAGHSIGYGEVLPEGVRRIRDLAKARGIDTFVDMGCGIGKGVVMARLLGFSRSVGVDVVSHRIDGARTAVSRLPPEFRAQIEVHVMDMFDYDLGAFGKPVCVFASNLLWSTDTNQRFFRKIVESCEVGTTIVSSKREVRPEDEAFLREDPSVTVPMSWMESSNCFVTTLVKKTS